MSTDLSAAPALRPSAALARATRAFPPWPSPAVGALAAFGDAHASVRCGVLVATAGGAGDVVRCPTAVVRPRGALELAARVHADGRPAALAVREITNASGALSNSAAAVDSGEDTGPLQSSLLGGNPTFHPIVARFLPRLDEETAALREALEAEDMVDIARIAHWLKGSAGNVGFAAFTAPTERLERCAKADDADGAARELARIERLVERVHAGWSDSLPPARSA